MNFGSRRRRYKVGWRAAVAVMFAGLFGLAGTAEPASFTVNQSSDELDGNLGDGRCDADATQTDDQCTLRAAIEEANKLGGAHSVGFQVATIAPGSALPEIRTSITVDGSTPDGSVILSGVAIDAIATPDVSGLHIVANKVTVRNMTIRKFSGNGVHVEGSSNIIKKNVISANGENGVFITGKASSSNEVRGNYLGTDPTGMQLDGNNGSGVAIRDASSNLIGGRSPADRNICSGNRAGIIVVGAAHGNRVEGNFIGTAVDGRLPLPNRTAGVLITQVEEQPDAPRPQGNVIGYGSEATDTFSGPCEGACNVISGNIGAGVLIAASSAPNLVRGNFIGTDVTGTNQVFNASGVQISISGAPEAQARGNIIEENLISGNNKRGVSVNDGGEGTEIKANRIGTNRDGVERLKNNEEGIAIFASGSTVGGLTEAERNLISGNVKDGIFIGRGAREAAGTKILGNWIGIDLSGEESLPNDAGVRIVDVSGVEVGNGTVSGRNVLSGNRLAGVLIVGAQAKGNSIQGNFIGTDVTGAHKVSNEHGEEVSNQHGVLISSLGDASTAASANMVGGDSPPQRNVISGNARDGVRIAGGASSNKILGNFIGVTADGLFALGNDRHGASISDGSGNQIGGDRGTGNLCNSACNVISGNKENGVLVGQISTTLSVEGNRIQGNFIGTAQDSAIKRGNSGSGVLVDGASRTLIGGRKSSEGNVISGNVKDGVTLANSANLNIITGNLIGTGVNGTLPMGNGGNGVAINDAPDNQIGGKREGTACIAPCNIIAANGQNGVLVKQTSTSLNKKGNRIQGNFIGTAQDSMIERGNSGSGVFVDGASHTLVGGSEPSEGNVIAHNGTGTGPSAGVTIVNASAQSNTIRLNSMHDNDGPGIDLMGDGPTLNDETDADVGPHGLLNAPVNVTAHYDGTNTTISCAMRPDPGT